MNYSNGLVTREKIIEICGDLFYQNGLTNTTYRDICQAADVKPGTLSHHFHGKANIASEIYYRGNRALDFDVLREFPDEDRRQQLLLFLYVQVFVMYADDNFARFVMEFTGEDIRVGTYIMYTSGVHSPVPGGHFRPESDDEDELSRFRASAYRGAQAALSVYFYERKKGITLEDGYKYWATIFLRLQGAQSDEIERRLAAAAEQVKKMQISWNGLRIRLQGAV